MSCSCTHIDYYNPCICGAIVSTSTTTTTTTLCVDGEPCEEAIDPRCIIYNGPDLPCYGIKTGDSAANILEIIIENFVCLTTTTTTTTEPPPSLRWSWEKSGDVTSSLYIQNIVTLDFLVSEKLDLSDSAVVPIPTPLEDYEVNIVWNGGDPQPIKVRLCDTTTNTEIYYADNIGELSPYVVEVTFYFTPVLGHSYNLEMITGSGTPQECTLL